MNVEQLNEQLFEALITGDRTSARAVVRGALQGGLQPQDLATELFWPTYQTLEKMHRQDQLGVLPHHAAVRLLRTLVDQNAAGLTQMSRNGRRVLAFCGASESDELGGQMAVDLLEAYGFEVLFAGGGVANDEILGYVNDQRPDVLLMFASSAGDLPNIRALIDTIQEIGAAPSLQVAVGGGVFNRAEGLAEEIGADLWAASPIDIVDRLLAEPQRRADAGQRTVGKSRKNRAAA